MKVFVFSVMRSSTEILDVVSVIHTNARDAAFAAIREVRRNHNLPEHVGLYTVQRIQADITDQEVK